MSRSMIAACVVLPLFLTACANGADSASTFEPQTQTQQGNGMFEVDVDVDTPQLRAAKTRAGVAPCPEGAGAADPVDGGLPDLTLACLGGGSDVNLSALRGPLVVNLWAQWCGPCREELPFYQRLHEQAGGKVSVIGIDYQDTQPAKALELIDQTGVTYPLLADPAGDVRVPFRVRALPGVVLVDENGQVAHIEYVVIRSYAQLRDLVEQHLDVSL